MSTDRKNWYFQDNSCSISQICISRTILVQSLKSVFPGQFLSNLSILNFQDNSCPSPISQFYISRKILVQSLKSVFPGQFLSKSNLSILYFQDNSCPISQICISRTILVQSLKSVFLGQFLSNLSNLYFQDNSCPSPISQFYISRASQLRLGFCTSSLHTGTFTVND